VVPVDQAAGPDVAPVELVELAVAPVELAVGLAVAPVVLVELDVELAVAPVVLVARDVVLVELGVELDVVPLQPVMEQDVVQDAGPDAEQDVEQDVVQDAGPDVEQDVVHRQLDVEQDVSPAPCLFGLKPMHGSLTHSIILFRLFLGGAGCDAGTIPTRGGWTSVGSVSVDMSDYFGRALAGRTIQTC
jgi:hypothetical protein